MIRHWVLVPVPTWWLFKICIHRHWGCLHSPVHSLSPNWFFESLCVIFLRSCSVPWVHPSSKSYPANFYSCRWESIDPGWCSLYNWSGRWPTSSWLLFTCSLSRWYFFLGIVVLSEIFDQVFELFQVRVHRDPNNRRIRFATIGTTAEVYLSLFLFSPFNS